jgi:amino acid transporter
MTYSRLMYGMADTGTLPKVLSTIHSRRRTPWVAILAATAIAGASTLVGDIEVIAQLSNFAVLVVFVMVNASLIYLRYARPDQERPFRSPGNWARMPIMALAGLTSSLFMLAQIRWEVLASGTGLAAVDFLVLLAYQRLIRHHQNLLTFS